ncbi:hypothetical protein Tmar_0044 [Thermaerobacter marianensis DSM 12885]|uniref:DUF3168 domain-containing protein n=1 Tax=Thermaerobacter marianensis (strain ATCC 700841 / DSM 12885 / JCM 10246 / 7p75a) TaxID=644966 RepID=E6SKI2_THEM7|nr:DUF3168 domain-containing protein [Thermaerobacter marianensis]ADU50169.1 hypothetical protein Tmar_0044 [Thermaerobacter marianensis DSM 12885]
MAALTQALYDRLAGDTELRTMLGTYKGQPAIFTAPPPGDAGEAAYPMIVTLGAVSDTPDDTKTSRGREVQRDITCYTLADGSMSQVEAIAERVRQLLHRQPLAVDGYHVWLAEVNGPILAETDDTVYGLTLTVRLRMEEV